MNELLTVKQFVEKYTAFKLGGVRNIIFYGDQNGLFESGAACRLGRKVLIDVPKFFEWVKTSPNTRGKK